MPYVLPSDVDERPVSVIGGGTLGRRIAIMFSAGGSRVQLFSRSAGSREAARRFVDEHAPSVREQLGLAARSPGTVEIFDALEPAVAAAWLIIESVSEDLALKKQVFSELDRLAEPDAILATNSSSYPSSRLLDAVESPERLLNVHFQMPPELIAVEPFRAAGPTSRSSTPSPGGCRATGSCPSPCGARASASCSTASGTLPGGNA